MSGQQQVWQGVDLWVIIWRHFVSELLQDISTGRSLDGVMEYILPFFGSFFVKNSMMMLIHNFNGYVW